MPPAKDGTIIVRVPLKLKQKIEDMAKEKNVSASELVRKLIEESVYKNEKELEEQIQFVNNISRYIDNLLKESAKEPGTVDVEKYTKEIREYKKLLYTHQSKVIKLLSDNITIDDSVTKSIRDDLRFINFINDGINNFINSNTINENFIKENRLGSKKDIEQKKESIVEMEWEKTDRLYSLMLKKYEENQDNGEDGL